jgi:hypothetical protein
MKRQNVHRHVWPHTNPPIVKIPMDDPSIHVFSPPSVKNTHVTLLPNIPGDCKEVSVRFSNNSNF